MAQIRWRCSRQAAKSARALRSPAAVRKAPRAHVNLHHVLNDGLEVLFKGFRITGFLICPVMPARVPWRIELRSETVQNSWVPRGGRVLEPLDKLALACGTPSPFEHERTCRRVWGCQSFVSSSGMAARTSGGTSCCSEARTHPADVKSSVIIRRPCFLYGKSPVLPRILTFPAGV